MTKVKWVYSSVPAPGSIEIRDADSAPGLNEADPLPPFDLTVLGADTWLSRIKVRLTNRILLIYFWLARRIWPFPPLPFFLSVTYVTRAVDVDAVLADAETFCVPYGPEMTDLAGGRNFMLGMDGPEHARQRPIVVTAIRPAQDAVRIGRFARRFAEALLDGSGGTIDVMKDLVTRVATETCADYFGFEIPDPDDFAEWAMSLSVLLFADPGGTPAKRALALNGAARVRDVVDRAIRKARANPGGRDSLVTRLAGIQGLQDDELRSILVGMVVGFIPTTTLAAARVMEELLRRPEAMAAAVEAAQDEERLLTVLWEVARLNPALQPGQWRYARRDATVGRKTIKAGMILLVATQSALRDDHLYDSPNQFQTGRPPRLDFPDRNGWSIADYIFGRGPHDCIGARLAMKQIAAVLGLLLAQPEIRPARGRNGRIGWIGAVPRRLDMTFQSRSPATQSMITILAPAAIGLSADELNREIAAFGLANPSPADSEIRRALDETSIVHFASLSAVELGGPGNPSTGILLELCVDGPQREAIDLVAERAGRWLEPVFRTAVNGTEPFAALLQRHSLRLKQLLPWGTTGLNFAGTDEFSVGDIGRQASLAAFCRDAIDFHLRWRTERSVRPWSVIDDVRRLISTAAEEDLARLAAAGGPGGERRQAESDELTALLRRAQEQKFADFLIRPSRRTLKFLDWMDPGPPTFAQQVWRLFSAAKPGRRVGFWLGFVAAAFIVINFVYLIVATVLGAPWTAFTPLKIFASFAIAVVCAVVWETLLAGVVSGLFLWRLRSDENSDVPNDRTPPLAEVRAAAANENPPGYVHNHFMAVTPLKPGLLRKFALAGALYAVLVTIKAQFRKGYVLNIGTIHYARWFRPRGTDTLIFLANYDGSWESYLEDFVMRAHAGQTAVWSNGVGFPRTSFLVKGGAQDGDRFKRWVRRQQRIAPFWYSRYPELTTSQIRNNALIHHGLIWARNAEMARAWLNCFGTMQRPDNSLEFDEIQTIVFSGLTDLPYGACAILRLPDSPGSRRLWLEAIMPARAPRDLVPLSFGDTPSGLRRNGAAAAIAFSARGLAKFGLGPAEGKDGLATFPGVFNIGMASRARVLGDPDPGAWTWSDANADAALFLFASSAPLRERLLEVHLNEIRCRGGGQVEVIRTDPVAGEGDKPFPREHFGFRDGISQPVIRGSRRSTMQVPERDLVAPGEFLFGYQNNLGYYPPSPTVRAESDAAQNLAVPMPPAADIDSGASRFPNFAVFDKPYLPHDFGRNGTFLAIRQFTQNVEGFWRFAEDAAEAVRRDYPHLVADSGRVVDRSWIASKLLGRRQDGTPLIGPSPGAGRRTPDEDSDRPDNDFAYGSDDPSGLQCPLGAHIRRANPRDGLDPGDPMAQAIANRHRILRRGRSFAKGEEKGLLFVALCGDLERQFEFLQQTWIGSTRFQGLTGESDPIAQAGRTAGNHFTVPTPSGPITLRGLRDFVEVKAGGYFFLPSRSALNYLIALETSAAAAEAPPLGDLAAE